MTAAWWWLLGASVAEVAWAVGLKTTHGFTRLWPSVFTVIVSVLSFLMLSQAMKQLPLGTAYAIWTGLGTVGTVVFGMILFHEPRDAARLACIGLILMGVVGLRVFSAGE